MMQANGGTCTGYKLTMTAASYVTLRNDSHTAETTVRDHTTATHSDTPVWGVATCNYVKNTIHTHLNPFSIQVKWNRFLSTGPVNVGVKVLTLLPRKA